MQYKFSEQEWQACLKVLNSLKDNPFENPDNQQFKTLITSIYKQAKKQNKQELRTDKKAADAALLNNTAIIANAREITTQFAHTESENTQGGHLQKPRNCYSCGHGFTQLHFFYHKLCPACAAVNYGWRTRQHNFADYNVIITGGRVKIGYAAVLKFLRSQANVILTTRFPALALQQLQTEADYDQWQHRLSVYGLDLRNLKAVEEFIVYCNNNIGSVDILINNAAQTIKYPADYYKPLMVKENALLLKNNASNLLPNKTPLLYHQDSLLLPGLADAEVPINRFGQPVDARDKNSWNSTLTEIELEELLEVNLINHISPYRLISGLKSLMLKSPFAERFVINVTSSEGQFSYPGKTIFHPHTNMTKAALNMLTRTSAPEFIKDSIFMTAVDVGWISTGANETKRAQQFADLKIPPLDPLDGATRIVHPIVEVLNGDKTLFGVLLKNYKVVDW